MPLTGDTHYHHNDRMANLKLGELQRRILQYGYDQWILRRAHFAAIQGVAPEDCRLAGAFWDSDCSDCDHITMPEATALSWQLKGYRTTFQASLNDSYDIWYLLGFSQGSWSRIGATYDLLDNEDIKTSLRRADATDALLSKGELPGLRANSGCLNDIDWWRWNWFTTISKSDPQMNAARTGASKALKGLEARGLITIERDNGRRQHAQDILERMTNEEHPRHINIGDGDVFKMLSDQCAIEALKGLQGKGHGKASTRIRFTAAAKAEVESWEARAMDPIGIPQWGMPLLEGTH